MDHRIVGNGRSLLSFCFLVLSFLFVHGLGPACAADKSIPLSVGYPATGVNYGQLFVAKDLGIFAKHGLDAKLTFVNSSTQAVPALRSGSVDVMTVPGEAPITAIGNGITDLVIFGNAMNSNPLEVWVQPEIKSVGDLKGKTIGSTSPGSLGDLLTGVWLKQHGLERSDVKIVYIGGLPNLVAAMRSQKIDATMLVAPLGKQLEASGQKKLTDLRDIPYASGTYVATKGFLESHADAIERFLRAVIEATAVLKLQPDRVLPVLPKYTGVQDAALNRYAYEFYRPLFERDPKMDLGVLKATQGLGTNPKVKSVDLTGYVNNSLVEKLEKENYIDKVWKTYGGK